MYKATNTKLMGEVWACLADAAALVVRGKACQLLAALLDLASGNGTAAAAAAATTAAVVLLSDRNRVARLSVLRSLQGPDSGLWSRLT